MKNAIKSLGIAALAVIIGFSMAACDSGGGSGGGSGDGAKLVGKWVKDEGENCFIEFETFMKVDGVIQYDQLIMNFLDENEWPIGDMIEVKVKGNTIKPVRKAYPKITWKGGKKITIADMPDTSLNGSYTKQ